MNASTRFVFPRVILLMILLLIPAILLQSRTVLAQPSVSGCGTISETVVWDSSNLYVLNGCGVTIEAGASLTIQPGTIVKLAGSHDKITVNGELLVVGTGGSPVVLTSLLDDSYGGDTNGDGAASTAAPGDWGWVLFNAGSSGTIEHAVIGYGGVGRTGYTHWAMVKVSGPSDVTIDHATLQNSWGDTLYAENVSVSVTNSRIAGSGSNSGSYGLNYNGLDPDTVLVIADNSFETERAGESAAHINLGDHPGAIRLLRNSATGNGWSGVVFEGAVQRDLSLDADDGVPLIVSTSFSVAAEATLTVSPGAIFKLAGCGGKVLVDGAMLASGTAESRIVFTSIKDDSYGGDTNGDGAASTPSPGDWGYVRFNTGSSGTIEHAVIGFGGVACSGYDNYSMLQAYDANVSLDHATLADSYGNGLWAENASVSVTNGFILGNGQHGGSAGLYYNGLDSEVTLEISDTTFETRSSIQVAARLSLGNNPAEILMLRNTATGSGLNGIVLGGTVQHDLRLGVSGSAPLVVEGSVGVAAEATLTLAPGTIFKPNGCGAKLTIDGTLVALGTEEAPIVFTSLKDDVRGGDTNGDGTASTPQPSDWGYVHFNTGSTGVLDHVFFGYGGVACSGYDTYTMLRASQAIVDVEHATFDAYQWNAVYSSEARLRIHRSSFPNDLPGNPTAIRNGGSQLWVDARHNWWGDATGPHNPSRNPGGSGAPVTDLVWFLPWAVDESGTEVTQLLVDGPKRVSPGETAEYAVSYYVADNLEDAVIVLDLPDSALHRDSGNSGTYMQPQHQVFWRLGEVEAGTEGTFPAAMRYPWGLPNGGVSPVMAWILASNLESEMGFTPDDLESYLTYVPPVVTGTIALTEPEIESERAAFPELSSLYEAAELDGLAVAGGDRVSFSDGTSMGSLVMFKRDEARLLLWQAGDALSYWVRPGMYGAADVGGAVSVDQSSLIATFSGTWASAEASIAPTELAPPAMSYGPCMRNCMLRDLQTMTQNGVLATLLSATCSSCWQGLTSGCNDCKVALYEQGFDRRYAINGCHDNCQGAGAADYRCTDSAALCINHSESSFWTPARHGSFAVFACDPVSGELRPERTVVCPDMHLCYQTRGRFSNGMLLFGEAESYIHQGGNGSAVCQRETVCTGTRLDPLGPSSYEPPGESEEVAQEEGARAQGCGLVLTTVRNAHDPNEKSGGAGDVVPGQELTYSVQYENIGAGVAYGVYITDELSPHLDETTLDLRGQGELIPATRNIIWDIGELAPNGEEGSKGERTFTVQVKEGLASGTVITNQAIVFFPSVPEETPTNSVVNVVQPLAAIPQSLETDHGTPIEVALLGRDVSGLPLTYGIHEQPLNGDLTGAGPNLTYTPAENFTGQDRFTFVANNGTSESHAADVTILVNPSPADISAPEVVWTYPEDGEALGEVPADAVATDGEQSLYAPSVLVGFSEPMDPTTITATAVRVTDGEGGEMAALVRWDGTVNQAVLVPHQPWQDRAYTVTVTTAARDASGNPLAAEHIWSFSGGGDADTSDDAGSETAPDTDSAGGAEGSSGVVIDPGAGPKPSTGCCAVVGNENTPNGRLGDVGLGALLALSLLVLRRRCHRTLAGDDGSRHRCSSS